jgi:hypothetical protein
MPDVDYHAWAHLPKVLGGTDGVERAVFHIKLFADDEPVITGDGRFQFPLDLEEEGYYLTSARLYVTTPSGSGDPTVMVRNVTRAVDMLTTPCSIDSGETTVGTDGVIDVDNRDVSADDMIAIDVDGAGAGTMGMGIRLQFGRY